MQICFYLLSLLFFNGFVVSIQPYFPSQIVFSANGAFFAIDEINQQALVVFHMQQPLIRYNYVMKHFPYAIPDSPQSKVYVQLSYIFPINACFYGTYWQYGGNTFNIFPSHWLKNETSFEIQNYVQFNSTMIHSKDAPTGEDYWYSTDVCHLNNGSQYPCEQIYFQKNTEIPLRLVRATQQQSASYPSTINFQVLSIGKVNQTYFDTIPKNWSLTCIDEMLQLLYNPQSLPVSLFENAQIQVWLRTPPHIINGNDTVSIQWNADQCADCLTWEPATIYFNSRNFHEKQILTVTRFKDGPKSILKPTFVGGGFDRLRTDDYSIIIQ